jgi:hypothetical protein
MPTTQELLDKLTVIENSKPADYAGNVVSQATTNYQNTLNQLEANAPQAYQSQYQPVIDNLMNQITFLTSMLYSQLGITEEVLKGTADEQTMLNYHNNTVAPVANAIVQTMRWKFLTKTARTRHHSIKYFRDPFRNTPVDKIAEMTDKFTRNEIASSNEMRSVIGWKPVDDPRADELRNKNLNATEDVQPMYTDENNEEGGNGPNAFLDQDIGKMRLSELLSR